MRIFLDCIPCITRQALDAARMGSDDPAVHERVMRRVMEEASRLSFNHSPPHMGRVIHRIVREESGDPDPYARVKKEFNELALAFLPRARAAVEASEDRLGAAVRASIAGNIMDFALAPSVEEERLREAFDEAMTAPLAVDELARLKDALENAESVLYICDNCGEIVFNRLLLEMLVGKELIVGVRGSPTINDATEADACAAGLDRLARIVPSGADVPGTILEECSEGFRREFDEADVVIAKGQGNYETLGSAPREVFFLLKAKCPVIARDIGCEVGGLVVGKTRR